MNSELRRLFGVAIFYCFHFVFCARGLAQTPPFRVHDPRIVAAGDWFYLFSTGRGIPIWRSHDLASWESAGNVFGRPPQWTVDAFPSGNYLWSPDVHYFGGQFHLYYAASHFGRNDSGIGHATNPTLSREDPNYAWTEHGTVLRTSTHDDWNAIDPSVFVDRDLTPWLVAGSFWSGIKLFRLDSQSGSLAKGDPIALARRHSPDALEAGCIFQHGDFYYLLVSFDYCCRGASSTYKLMVGRARDIAGPYLDFDRRPLMEGGGALLLGSYDHVRGPGHGGVFLDGERELLVHHFYDSALDGRSLPQVRPLIWPADGWPLAGEPITVAAPTTQPTIQSATIAGRWIYSLDYGSPFEVQLLDDGKTRPNIGQWKLDVDDSHRIQFTVNSKNTNTAPLTCYLSNDNHSFIGRNAEGSVVRGLKP